MGLIRLDWLRHARRNGHACKHHEWGAPAPSVQCQILALRRQICCFHAWLRLSPGERVLLERGGNFTQQLLGGHDWISDVGTNTYYTFLDGLTITNCVAENRAHGFGTAWYYPVIYRSRLKNLVMEDNYRKSMYCNREWTPIDANVQN